MGTEQETLLDAAEMGLNLAEKEAERALERLEAARQRYALAEAAPIEPEKGSVIKFTIQYPNAVMVYTYAALRAPDGHWYVTGQEKGKTWGQMTRNMMLDQTAKTLGIGFYLYDNKGKGKWVGRTP